MKLDKSKPFFHVFGVVDGAVFEQNGNLYDCDFQPLFVKQEETEEKPDVSTADGIEQVAETTKQAPEKPRRGRPAKVDAQLAAQGI